MTLRAKFEQYLVSTGWAKRGAWAWAVRDVSMLYGKLVQRRKDAFAKGKRASFDVGVPVIVVGNVIAGGAGKTPVCLSVVAHLQQRGYPVGIISRGFGRKNADGKPRPVDPGQLASIGGDEPTLIARRSRAPVWVGADRVATAKALLAAHPATQVIVSDDGLQHWALKRRVEVVVFDERGVGNGWPLPAGPMREAWPRTAMPGSTQLVLRSAEFPQKPVELDANSLSVFDAPRVLSGYAVQADGTRITLGDLAALSRQQSVNAVAAIAKPQGFFDMLKAANIQLNTALALPDHFYFDSNKLNESGDHSLKSLKNDSETWLCTEKDAVKLWAAHPTVWAVPLEVNPEPEFWTALDIALQTQAATQSAK